MVQLTSNAMIKKENFLDQGSRVMQWVNSYFQNIESLPVKSTVRPREVYNALPHSAPEQGESMESILADLDSIIIPGVTHWQHPNFHAYFPANSSYESLLGEVVTAAIGAQCMVWETSPAAAELEERVMEWLRDAAGLPADFKGVIQESASSSTLTAILTARERATDFRSNFSGVPAGLRVYCSNQAHSSIEKAVGIAGIGRDNLVKIGVDSAMRMDPVQLEAAICADLGGGLRPICVVAAIGTTGTVAIDPLEAIADICQRYGLWLHVDAAYAGTALLLPEYRSIARGIEQADSLVFNPHKWMFVNFDCSAYYVKDPSALIRTFDILPEYLKTATHGTVNDYRDWGIPLGRRFRALKLWFVMRGFGLEGLRQTLRNQIALNEDFARQIDQSGLFQIMQTPHLGFTSFRYRPHGVDDEKRLEDLNRQLLEAVNQSGRIYISHTKVDGHFVLRFHSSQTYVEQRHIDQAVQTLIEAANKIWQQSK